MVIEGAMQASKQGEFPTVLPSYDVCELQQPNVTITILRVLSWQACLGGDHHLSSWI